MSWGRPNVGLRGRVVDERGRPQSGLFVEAVDVDVGKKADFLGRAVTDADGRFSMSYPPSAYRRLLDLHPDVLVRVFGPLGLCEVARAGVFDDVADEVFEVPELVVPRAAVEGWAATLGRETPSRLSRGNRVDVLKDHAQFAAIAEAVRAARSHVHLAQLLFKTSFEVETASGERVNLARELARAADRGVAVRVLLNENAVVPDDVDELTEFFREESAGRVRVRPLFMTPHAMHAKMLVVDDRDAFVIGSPFQQKFWDTPDHRGTDPRRGNDRPTHDLSVRLRGPAVRDVAESFALLWNAAGDALRDGNDRVLAGPAPPEEGPQAVQLVRTVPRATFDAVPDGEQGILEAYLRALESAKGLVYLENQYFTSGVVVEAIRRSLDRRPELEVVLVLNDDVDIPTYVQWQKRRVRELAHPRCGAFVLARETRAEDRPVAPLYVHSKAAVVDDAWATVGTANLDSISLRPADEFLVEIRSNVDVNVVLLDGVDGHAATGLAGALRRWLWSEHFALPADEFVAPPPDGWLALWRRAAEHNRRALESGGRLRGRVLPYLPDAPLTKGLSKTGPG